MQECKLKDSKNQKKTCLSVCVVSAFLTAGIILLLYACLGLAPFGNRALIYSDGQFQMVDLFCWYKDVLCGKASIGYSFSKSLGGSNFAVFTYYLASPLSLLVVFFSKAGAPSFIDFLFAAKSFLAALFSAYYLMEHFRPTAKMQYSATVILSVSYALSPFFLSQSSNTMWLDGAYLLPLILLGCEKLVNDGRSTLLTVSIALAICFNWYSGIIDLMFVCFWLLFSMGIKLLRNAPESKKVTKAADADSADHSDKETPKKQMEKEILLLFGRFALSCATALLLSCALLLPTLLMLSGRTHGSSGLSMLKDLSMIGPVGEVFSNYSWGMISVKGSVSLFSGSFVFFGVVLLFLYGRQRRQEKYLFGGLLLFSILMFFWQPLVAVFSMFREVESYWYRYSYLGSFVLVYLAAEYFLTENQKRPNPISLPAIAGCFMVILFLFSKLYNNRIVDIVFVAAFRDLTNVELDLTMASFLPKILFPLLLSLLMWLFYCTLQKKKANGILCGLIALSLFAETFLGLMVLGIFYTTKNAGEISDYTRNEMALLSSIENEPYTRVLQTSYHSIHFDAPASYNEPMAYGFPSVTSFVSDPDENTIMFLDRAGYPQYSETITVTAQENLALDSLLGVGYILLDDADPNTTGLEYINGIAGFKKLYRNPYAAPVAFTYAGTGSFDSAAARPYEYLNELFRMFSGINKDIFSPVSFASSREGNTLHYVVDTDALPDPATQILYANLPTNTDEGAAIELNGQKYLRYSQFLAPSMIRIPTGSGAVCLDLIFDETAGETADVLDAQFFLLDLPTLEEAVSNMRTRACTSYEIKDGHCRFEVTGNSGDSLFTTVPLEKGWSVSCNGKKVEPAMVAGALMSIPLESGTNTIEMTYHVPYLSAGIVLTVLGIVLLAATIYLENKKKCALPEQTEEA